MPPPRCTCAFRLYHFQACLSPGGAACSRRGEPPGSKNRAASDKEAAVAAYLGRTTGSAEHGDEEQTDEYDESLGFAEDKDLLVSASRAQPRPPSHLTLWRLSLS